MTLPVQSNALIVPSFFHLIHHLQKTHREFNIYFRSFGADLPKVIQEFNTYATGNHPIHQPYRLMDGSIDNIDRRVYPENSGVFYRDKNSSSVYIGTLSRP